MGLSDYDSIRRDPSLLTAIAAEPSTAAQLLGLEANLQRDYGASMSSETTTGSITAGSTTLTLTSPIDFANGQGVYLLGGGPVTTVGTVGSLTVTVEGTTGTTTYTYYVSAIGADSGGLAAAVSATVTTGDATLSLTNYNKITWTAPTTGTAAGYLVWGASTNPSGSQGLLGYAMGTTFFDYGTASQMPGELSYIYPSSPPTSATGGPFWSTIVAGAGTTTLTLAHAATTSASNVLVLHDDTGPLMSAILSGDPIFVPPGQCNYRPIGNNATITNDLRGATSWEGAGPVSTLAILPNSAWIIQADDAGSLVLNYGTISRINFVPGGNAYNTYAPGAAIITAGPNGYAGNAAIRDCFFGWWPNDTISDWLAGPLQVSNCEFFVSGSPPPQQTGIHINSSTTGFLIDGCVFDNVAFVQSIHVYGGGGTVRNCQWSSVQFNHYWAGPYLAGFGVLVDGGYDVVCSGNLWEEYAHYPLFVQNAAINVTLADNVVLNGSGPVLYPVCEIRQASHVRVIGNAFLGGANSTNGIEAGVGYAAAPSDIVIVGNTVVANANAILTAANSAASVGLVIADNWLQGGAFGVNASNVQDAICANNIITVCGEGGVQLAAGTARWSLTGNRIFNNTGPGILLTSGIGPVQIQGNAIYDTATTSPTQTYGVDGTPSGTVILGNTFAGNATAAINLTSGQTGVLIADNPGYNPVGLLTAPAVPASGTALANPFYGTVRVFVSGGTVSAIAVNGTATGLTSGLVVLGPGDTITLTYTAAPTWVWMGL